MDPVITRLHPDLPICWEDPDTLRFGFEQARARIRRPTAGAQRFIGFLIGGIEAGEVGRVAARAGITSREAQRLLSDLGPALLTSQALHDGPSRQARKPLRTRLYDDGTEVPGLRDALSSTGICDLDAPAGRRTSPDLVIHVERFLEPLERAQRWLVAGIPHLLLRFTDGAVHVGPLVSERGFPCHTCLTLALLSEDAAYPILAAQLSGRSPRSETTACAHMAAAYAAVLLRRWLIDDPTAHTQRIRIPVSSGLVVGTPDTEDVVPHPECACGIGIASSADPAPPGSVEEADLCDEPGGRPR